MTLVNIYFKGGVIMAYIGTDLHTNKFNICTLDHNGQTQRKTFCIEEEQLKEFYSMLSKNDSIVFEASTNSFAFYDLIKDKVKNVYIVDPMRFQLICRSNKKNDKIDAEKLANMLKYHVEYDNNFLPLVYVPEENIRKSRSLFTTYQLYKKEIVCLKNRVHSILKQTLNPYNGEEIDSKEVKETILKLDIDKEYKTQIEIIYETLEVLEEKAEKIKKEILYLGREHMESIEILTSLNGISIFIALAVITDYANNIGRFKNGKHFSSYMRSVPKLDASNEKIKNGSTKKTGRRLSITLVLQALPHILNIDPYLCTYYKNKTKGKKKGVMRMAIARRIFVRMYKMLKNKEYYRYSNNFRHEFKVKQYRNFIKKYEKTV